MNHTTTRKIIGCLCLALLTACGASLPTQAPEGRHLQASPVLPGSGIPDPVQSAPVLPQPGLQQQPELYSVVVQDVPVRELLFAMARDAGVNIDVHPGISGTVSLNAIDQTLPQILQRIARQVDMRWTLDENNGLMVEPDSAYLRSYRVDYVNVARAASTQMQVSSSIVSVGDGGSPGGSGSNNSVSTMSQSSSNDFWPMLTSNLRAILGEGGAEEGGAEEGTLSAIVANPASGIVTVRANEREHGEIQSFLDLIHSRSLSQVLIEATVVEVTLNDRYQAGVDWATFSRDNGQINFIQSLTGLNLSETPTSMLSIDKRDGPDAIAVTMKLLSQFGDLKVLSSPKIMALNNQAAMLRVVDNKVYFQIEVEPGIPATPTTAATPPVYTSTVHTVPVGFVMNVTPQIGDNDQVTLNVRPTISRIVRYVNDPSPALAEAGVSNPVPEIQIREIESILKVFSGEIAVLGGLMQDSLETGTSGVPGLSRLPGIRNLFSYRDDTAVKTELIVFIRPVVVRQASLDGDLRDYRQYLPADGVGISDFYSSSSTYSSRDR